MPPLKQRAPDPSPPTYPARPINGGKLEVALETDPLDPALWMYRPKWNGRRCLLHLPTMRTWNRQLEQNNWVFPAFKKLLDVLMYRSDIWPPALEWLDVELLYGKTSVAQRSIIVLDFVSDNMIWLDRNATLAIAFEEHLLESVSQQPEHDQVYFFHPPVTGPDEYLLKVWQEMQDLNQKWGVTFYEGFVAYNIGQKYPVQLFSPTKETRHWIKYRFIN